MKKLLTLLLFSYYFLSFSCEFELNEIQPAPLKEEQPLLQRSNSWSSVIIYSSQDEGSDDEILLLQRPILKKIQTKITVIDIRQLFNLIEKKDHEKISSNNIIISYNTVNQKYKERGGLRPLAYAAICNAPSSVFQALFARGADPDFKEHIKDDFCCSCSLFFWRKKIIQTKPLSARQQIRNFLHNKSLNQEKKEYLLKVLRNLNKSDPQCRSTWRKETVNYAEAKKIPFKLNNTNHILL